MVVRWKALGESIPSVYMGQNILIGMPIVTIEIFGGLGRRAGKLAQALADECSPAFPPNHREVWLHLRLVPGENWTVSNRSIRGPLPVFVHVVREVNPRGAKLRREIERLTGAVARVTGRPQKQVHVIYEPSAKGRMAFGGRLLS